MLKRKYIKDSLPERANTNHSWPPTKMSTK